jgi:hypothetical protein
MPAGAQRRSPAPAGIVGARRELIVLMIAALSLDHVQRHTIARQLDRMRGARA